MIKAFHSGLLESPHAFFTRVGGVSEGIFNGLNCSKNKGDNDTNVDKNRNLCVSYIGEYFGFKNTPRLVFGKQTHSSKAIYIPKDFEPTDSITLSTESDGYVTKNDNLLLAVFTADCCPILFEDNPSKIVGAAHAGWKGSMLGIIENTIDLMIEHGAKKNHIQAALGPCMKKESFEVKNDFIEQVEKNTNFEIAPYVIEKNETFHFDLTQYITTRLKNHGIQNIACIPLDTYTNDDLFFSFRRSTHLKENSYGTQISCIGIKK